MGNLFSGFGGRLSRFEGRMEDTVEGAAGRLSNAPLSPVKISKEAEKAMRRERMVGSGRQYAPTLYTVWVNVDDDRRLFGMYPTLAGETEMFLSSKAQEQGMVMDGAPLVRFIADPSLRQGKFKVEAEAVAGPIVAQLRREEMDRYGLLDNNPYGRDAYGADPAMGMPQGGAPDPYAAPAPGPYSPDVVDPYAVTPVNDPYAPATQPYYPQNQAAPQAAAAPAPAPARLVDRKGNKVYPLEGAKMLAGRGSDCDISIPDINCSRHHALFTQQAHGVWLVEDQGSTNGTVINGRQITAPEPLYEGTEITLGLTTLVFSMV